MQIRFFSALLLFCSGPVIAQPRRAVLTNLNASELPWHAFQVDEHLALQIPSPARLISAPPLNGHSIEAYLSSDSNAYFTIMRLGLTAAETDFYAQSGQQDNLYTGLTQALLTKMRGVRVSQSVFQVGKFEGLAVQFRTDSASGFPTNGTLWAIRVLSSFYLLNCLPQTTSEKVKESQKRFLNSLTANDKPYLPPTTRDWSKFRKGRFRYLDPIYNAVVITRTDSIQTEVDTNLNKHIEYKLRWTNEGYELRQLSSTFPNAADMQGKLIRVRITGVDGKKCFYKGNLEGMVLTGAIEQLSD